MTTTGAIRISGPGNGSTAYIDTGGYNFTGDSLALGSPSENDKGGRLTLSGNSALTITNNVIIYEDNNVVFKELAVADTAYNFYVPVANKRFVITGITIKADRDVSNTVDAIVIIYEASSEDTLTVDKEIYQEAMIRGERATLLPLNIILNEGVWLNAKTSDDDIYMTIMGYYIPA